MKHPEGSITAYVIKAPYIKESRLGICVITAAEEKLCHQLEQDTCAKISYLLFLWKNY